MRKLIFHVIMSLLLVLFMSQACFSDDNNQYEQISLADKKAGLPGWWNLIKGERARDSLHLGMWSLHLDGSGDISGTGRNREHNHLIGIQYKGFNAGTFVNSHNDRTYTAGLSRDVYVHQISENLRFDAGYRVGLLYGYKDNLPSIKGVSAYAMPVFGLSWKRIGIDIGVVPVGILTLNLRIDLDRKQPAESGK